MSLTDNLSAPVKEVFIDNENALHRYTLVNPAAAAAPVTPVDIYGVQDVTPGAVSYKKTFEGMQQGGRGERRKIMLQPEYNVDIKLYLKDALALVPALLGQTWGAGGHYGIPLAFEDKPLINLESIYRLPSGTHAGSLVCPDLILKDFAPNFGSDGHITTLPFYSKFLPFEMKAGAEMVYDVFAADGSSLNYTLSATPLNIVDVSERANMADLGWVLDNCVYVKVRAASADIATLQTSGFQITGTDLAFTVAPAAGTKIEVYYAKATA